MGRAVDGRPIEGEDLKRLRQTNDVLQKTREALPIGRGNVTTDLAATNGHSHRTCVAARDMTVRLRQPTRSHWAAIAEIAGAGNCGEHAAVALHKLAADLSPGQEVHKVGNSGHDHSWAELRTPGSERPTIVVDAWGEGPAFHAEDGLFSSPAIPAEQRRSVYSYDAHTARSAVEDNAEFVSALSGELTPWIAELRAKLPVEDVRPQKIFGPTPVIDNGFADRVSEKMAHVDDMALFRQNLPAIASTDLRNDLLATSVLRQMGASVRDATAAAREVSLGAGALTRAPQNPPRASEAAQQAYAAEQPVRQTLLELFPSRPSDATEDAAASTSARTRDREPDADHDDRSVRQRI